MSEKHNILIPDGTIALLQMSVRPGGYNDETLCLEAGFGTQAKSGVIYLRSKVKILAGSHKDKSFSVPIGIFSDKGDQWRDRGRKLVREILNSSQGLSASDNSRRAVAGRIIKSYSILDGICFVGVVGVTKNQRGKEENNILRVLNGDHEEYQDLVSSKKFVPARKVPPPSEPSSPMWRR